MRKLPALALLGLLSTAGAVAQDDDFTAMDAGTPGIMATEVKHDLTLAASSALAAADADMKNRGVTAPDAAYVKILESTYASFDSKRVEGADQIRSLYATTTDDVLLKNDDYAKNLRALFETQSVAQSEDEGRIGIKVIGGARIPSAIDVVGLASRNSTPARTTCTGVMISPRHVMTAAHCVCMGQADVIRMGEVLNDAAGFTSYLVVNQHLWPGLSCPAAGSGLALRVEEATRGRDLAILEADSDIIEGKARSVVSANAFERWKKSRWNTHVRAAGYGFSRIDHGGRPVDSGVRLFADIAVASLECRSVDPSVGCIAGREMFAKGNRVSAAAGAPFDTCSGDSGGPIYGLFDGDGETAWHLLGLTSRGRRGGGCGDGGIYSLIGLVDILAWVKGRVPEVQVVEN